MAFRPPLNTSERRRARSVAFSEPWGMRSALSWLVAVGVLVRLGASLECCGEGASFWDDLDDPARTPAGAGPGWRS